MKEAPPAETAAPEPDPEPELAPPPEPEAEPQPPVLPEPGPREAETSSLPDPTETDPVQAPSPPPPAELEPVEDAPIFADTASRSAGYVRVDRPGARGSWLMFGAGATLAGGLMFQIGDRALCGGCGIGVVERVFFAHTFTFAALAGMQRGKADAFDDAVVGRERNVGAIRAAGAVLLGTGLVVGLVNEGLWWAGVGGDGPYSDVGGTDFVKIQSLSRGLLDVAVIAGSAGVGLLAWQHRYRRDRRAYRNARVLSLAPQLRRDYAGVNMQGAF